MWRVFSHERSRSLSCSLTYTHTFKCRAAACKRYHLTVCLQLHSASCIYSSCPSLSLRRSKTNWSSGLFIIVLTCVCPEMKSEWLWWVEFLFPVANDLPVIVSSYYNELWKWTNNNENLCSPNYCINFSETNQNIARYLVTFTLM